MSMYLKSFILICVLGISCSSMMPGGWMPVSNDNPEAQKHAKYAAHKISASSNSIYHMKVTNISNVKRQVVSGIQYSMTITLAPTECKKNQNLTRIDVDDCQVLPCKAQTSCNVKVWVQAWLKEKGTKLTESSCHLLPVEGLC